MSITHTLAFITLASFLFPKFFYEMSHADIPSASTEKTALSKPSDSEGKIQSEKLQKTLKKLDQTLKSIKSVSARFTQEIHLKTADIVKKSQGELHIMRPSNLRWEIKSPNKSLYLSSGKSRWIYTPPFSKDDQGQAIRIKSNETEKNITLRLLSGKSSLLKEFKIIAVKNQSSSLRLKPLDKTQRDAKYIDLTLSKESGYPERVIIHQLGGNITRIRLTQTTLNGNLNPEIFKFTPPKGTAIIEQ